MGTVSPTGKDPIARRVGLSPVERISGPTLWGRVLLAGVAVLVIAPVPCGGVGLYEDIGRFSFFLRSARYRTIDGRTAFTEGTTSEAAVFAIGIQHPAHSAFLIGAHVSFATNRLGDSLTTGSGDLRLSSKGELWAGNDRSLYLLAGLRFGIGDLKVFPYASSSFDFELGLAYVDTLSSVTWWATAGGVVVAQVDSDLKENGLYGNYALTGGGVVFSLRRRLDLQVGAMAYGFREGGERLIYFSDLDFKYSQFLAANVLLQVEGGNEAVRAYDYAIVFGVRASY
ncbi:MAG: hypothetical protein O7D32_11750 [bacterium]|nr:hypothetical protein [bacterium]